MTCRRSAHLALTPVQEFSLVAPGKGPDLAECINLELRVRQFHPDNLSKSNEQVSRLLLVQFTVPIFASILIALGQEA